MDIQTFHPRWKTPAAPRGRGHREIGSTLSARRAVEPGPGRSVGVRMAPLHMKRKFWWELILISLLVFLLASARSQRKQELAAAVVTVPLVPPAVVVAPLMAPLALK